MSKLENAIRQFKIYVMVSAFLFSFCLPVSGFSKTNSIIVINPESIKQFILSKNVSLMVQMNQVEQAKMKVNIARGNLLPSINLGAVISSGTTFGLSTISMLVPFLFPSNWMNLKQSFHLLNSQTKSYYIAKLNTYASAYSTYLNIVADLDLHDVLNSQYENYQQIEDFIRVGVEAGLKQPSELMQAHAQTAMAAHQVSKIDQLLKQEISLLRQMLALPLSQELVIERKHPLKSSAERWDMQSALQVSIAKSPELQQLEYLHRAAKAAKWSQAFAFLNGGGIGSSNSSANGAWSPTQFTGSMSIGAAYYPTLQLSNLNVAQIQLQKNQTHLQHAQTVESIYSSLAEAQKQVAVTSDAEMNLREYYQTELLKLRTGLTDLLHVLSAANNLTLALTSRIRSQNDLDNQRVSLNRLLIEQEFMGIPPCNAMITKSNGFEGSSFKTSDKNISVEKFCDNLKSH